MASSYEQTLAQLTQSLEDRYLQQINEHRSIEKQKLQLTNLLARIVALPAAFDSEDREHVEQQLHANVKRMSKLKKDMELHEIKRKEQAEVFRCMNAAIRERARVLEEDDACLSIHPDMLQFFARKQVGLQSLLDSKMRETCLARSADAASLQAQEHRFEFGSHPNDTQASHAPV